MEKDEIVRRVIRQLREQHDRMVAAGQSAEEYATDAESRSESKYDTRSLEASYLAAGQARKAEELAEAVDRLQGWNPSPFGEGDPIETGALVEVDRQGELQFYLLAPAGGGVVTAYLGCDLTVVTPDSPLGRALTGRKAGDVLENGSTTIYGVE